MTAALLLKRDGHRCVYCSTPLVAETAVVRVIGEGHRVAACGACDRTGRQRIDYSAGRPIASASGYRIDQPVAGYFATRLRSGGVRVGVRIWFGPPHDPVTGDVMDRSHRWQAEANGRYIELDRVWPKCAGEPIDEAEYRFLSAQQRWGEEYAPDSPQADPTRRANPLESPILF